MANITAIDSELEALDRILGAPRRRLELGFRRRHLLQRQERAQHDAAVVAIDPEYPFKLEAAQRALAAAKAEVERLEGLRAASREKGLVRHLKRAGEPPAGHHRALTAMVGGLLPDPSAKLIAAKAEESFRFAELHRLQRWATTAPFATSGGPSAEDVAYRVPFGPDLGKRESLRAEASKRVRERFDRLRGRDDAA